MALDGVVFDVPDDVMVAVAGGAPLMGHSTDGKQMRVLVAVTLGRMGQLPALRQELPDRAVLISDRRRDGVPARRCDEPSTGRTGRRYPGARGVTPAGGLPFSV